MFLAEVKLTVPVQSAKPIFSPATGQEIGKQKKLCAFFTRGAAPDWAKAEGLRRLEMRGVPEGVDPATRIAVFDSVAAQIQQGWTDDERERVEAHLRTRQGIIEIDQPKVPAPYALYTKHRKVHGRRTADLAVKDILAAYETAGFDVQQALAYERSNTPVPEIVQALEQLAGPTVEDEAEPLIAA